MQPSGGLLSFGAWNVSLEWSEEEQRTLEAAMMRFPAERMDPLQRYVRIAAALPRKGVRDVALRVRWMAMQTELKRRTGLDPRGASAMPALPHAAAGAAGPKPAVHIMPPLPGGSTMQQQQQQQHHVMPPPPGAAGMATDGGPPTVDGPISHLLDANLAILNHFRTNMAVFKVHENTQLLVQFRDNILQILQAMEAMGGAMKDMPELPVHLNVDLANSFLPSRPTGMLSYDGMTMPPPPQPALNAPGMVPINGPGLTPGGGGSGGMATGPPPQPPLPPRPPGPPHHGMPGGGAPLPPGMMHHQQFHHQQQQQQFQHHHQQHPPHPQQQQHYHPHPHQPPPPHHHHPQHHPMHPHGPPPPLHGQPPMGGGAAGGMMQQRPPMGPPHGPPMSHAGPGMPPPQHAGHPPLPLQQQPGGAAPGHPPAAAATTAQ